jgi:signal transduction histidine kinase/DNA-binding NarL/FixJ family response regulator
MKRPFFRGGLPPARPIGQSGLTRAFAQVFILLTGLALIGLTWLGTLSTLRSEERAAIAHENAELASKALLFETQVRRRLLAVDQTLRILEDDWERDPAAFDLPYWQRQARVLSDLALYLYVTDAQGTVRMSSRPDLVGVDFSLQPAFRDRARLDHDDGELFIGAGAADPVNDLWQISIARRLDSQGTFAGVIGLSYNTAVGSFFNSAEMGSRSIIALVDTEHGLIYASAGMDFPGPGDSIAGSPLFEALRRSDVGRWTGVSAPGQPNRLYAFRRVVERPFQVVLGVDAGQALAPFNAWRRGAYLFATGTTLFLVLIMALLTWELRAIKSREARLIRDRLLLEEAYSRQAAARQLAEARSEQLDATLLGMSDGVSMVDGNMRLIQWNSQFCEYTGVPAAMMRVGLPMEDALRAQAELGEFGPVDVETEVARRMAMLRSRSHMGVIERARPNGRTMELRRRALPTGGFVTLYSDITERKQAEQALENARKLAEAAVADKSSFVAIVSHEIRTPLNTLLNALTLLEAGELPARQRDILGVARQSGAALIGLLNDILEMSRADAGQLTLRPADFAVRPLLEGVLEIFREPAGERGITLRLDCAAEVPNWMFSDAGRLRQVLMNLVSNAVKYSRQGQVVLRASTRLADGRTLVRFAVCDAGPAIDPAERHRLFQPFSRLEQHSSHLRPGTGLGLVICERLTTLMGGEIGHLEAAGNCNEFWITVPIQVAPVQVGSAGNPGGTPDGDRAMRSRIPRTRLLLVDDIGANRAIIAALLRREGHLVDVAGSGSEALAAVERAPYDLILMDIFMPDMNGLEAARRLRRRGGVAASVPIIALTANTGKQEMADCLAAGMNDMICKPAEMPTLLEAIARHAWPGSPVQHVAGKAPVVAAEAAQLAVPLLNQGRMNELRSNLAPDLLARLVVQCLEDLAQRLPALQKAIVSGQYDRIDAEAHAMAGLAASYAMSALEARLQRLLQQSRANDLIGIRRTSAGLETDLTRTDGALRSMFLVAPV